jgi:uncharacterized protein (TIGR02186 family)
MSNTSACFLALRFFLLIAFVSSIASPVLAGSSDLKASPSSLEITESFDGAPVAISASIPKGASAVVELTGEAHEAALLRKGRRGGLWMSVGEVKVQGAPSTYLLMSSAADLLTGPDTASQWGYDALGKQVKFSGALPKDGASALFKQFIKLKESEGLYGIFPGSLKADAGTGDSIRVQGTLRMPSNIPCGAYTASLTVLDHGRAVERKSVDFSVEMKGLPSVLAALAHANAILYGVLAVVIAIVVGFVMGYVFKGKAAH